MYPALFRRVDEVVYERERIELPDTDFLDLDWSKKGNQRLTILLHGLEGSSEGSYIKGMVRVFNREGWDVVAVNFRGCSGEANRLLRSYHAGATEDLRAVLAHAMATCHYEQIALVGFSLGGNLLLKYLGEEGSQAPSIICGAVGISVPCDLAASVEAMSVWSNSLYMKRFMRNLRAKMVVKGRDFPGEIDISGLDQITTFQEFDDLYTAPLHGFGDADTYWRTCSCISGLEGIRIPTLILSAEDDPFLAPACYPWKEAEANPDLFLEVPRFGGHVGFVGRGKEGIYWSEHRTMDFFASVLSEKG